MAGDARLERVEERIDDFLSGRQEAPEAEAERPLPPQPVADTGRLPEEPEGSIPESDDTMMAEVESHMESEADAERDEAMHLLGKKGPLHEDDRRRVHEAVECAGLLQLCGEGREAVGPRAAGWLNYIPPRGLRRISAAGGRGS